ncbi:MAG: hypothetical protein HN482_10850, partial [Bdellovibrionales bacterium]|nr:hypothetical protein [Bdellovibrionales bacterium]
NCTSAQATFDITSGATTASFYFNQNTVGSPTLTIAGSGGITSATQAQSIVPNDAYLLAISSATQTLEAGVCSTAAVTVDIKDEQSNLISAPAGTTFVVASSSTSGTTFFTNSDCSTPLTGGDTVAVTTGASSGSFYFKESIAGTPTLTASGFTVNGTKAYTVNPTSAHALEFTSSAQTVAAGTCSSATTARRRDIFNNITNIASATTVNLSSPFMTFYSDSSCSIGVGSVAIASGATQASFYFKQLTTGSPVITISGATVDATQTQTIEAGSPYQLQIISGTSSVTAGSCSGVVTVMRKDQNGNINSSNTVTTVTPTGSGLSFYSDSSCSSSITTSNIIAGSSTTQFYFSSTTAGSPALNIAGLTDNDQQNQTITAAAAHTLEFDVTSTINVAAEGCSEAVTINILDQYSNPVPVASNTTFNIASDSSGTVNFYSGAGCTSDITNTATVTSGNSSTTIYFKDTKSGNFTLTASGLTTDDTRAYTVAPAAPDTLAITSSAANVIATRCSHQVTVERQDSSGNAASPASTTTVSLAGGSLSFYSDSSCSSSITDVTISALASNATFYFKQNSVGTPTLTVSGLTVDGTQALNIISDTANTLEITSSASAVLAGACSSAITVARKDQYGTLVDGAISTTVNISGSGMQFYASAGCGAASITSVDITSGAGQTNFYFKRSAVGTQAIAVSGLTVDDSQLQTINPNVPDQLSFTAGPASVIAGECSTALTIEVSDTYGNTINQVGGTSVTLASDTSGTANFYSDSGCGVDISSTATVTSGSSTTTIYYKDTMATSATTITASGFTTDGTRVLAVDPASPDSLEFYSTASDVVAGACSEAVQFRRLDQYNNITDFASATSVTPSGGSMVFYSDDSCSSSITTINISSGNSSNQIYFKQSVVGTPTLTIGATGVTSATQGQTIVSAPAHELFFNSSTASIVAGECSSAINIQLKDQYSNLVAPTSGQIFTIGSSASASTTFYSDSGCSTDIGTTATISSGSNNTNIYFKDTLAATPTLTISGLTVDDTLQFTITPAAPDKYQITTSAVDISAGSCSNAVTVQRLDEFDNVASPASSSTVNLGSSSGNTVFYSDADCTGGNNITTVDIASAQNSATLYFKQSVAESFTFTASGLTTDGTQLQTVTAAYPFDINGKLVFTTSAQSVAAGNCSGIVTVHRKDGYDNLMDLAFPTNFDVNSANMTFFSDSSCTTTKSTFRIDALQHEKSFYFRQTLTGSPVVTISASSFDNGTQTETITADAPYELEFSTATESIVAGACSSLFNVQLKDQYDNLVTVASNTNFTMASSDSAGTTFYSDACTTSIGTTATIASGQNSVNLYFKDTVTGTATLTASGFTTDGTQNYTITADSEADVGFSSAAQSSVVAGTCSAALTVQRQDQFGNAVAPASTTDITVTSNSGNTLIYNNSDCSDAGGASGVVTISSAASTANIYFSQEEAESFTLTATSSISGSGTQAAIVIAATPNTLQITSTAQSVVAGSCSGATVVTAKDQYGNAGVIAAGMSVALASNQSTTFYDTSGCGGSAVTSIPISAGAGTATFYFKQTAIGTPTLTASGLTNDGTQVETITSATATQLAVTSAAQNSIVAGTCSSVITVEARDLYSNAISTGQGSITVNLSSNSAGSPTFYSAGDSSCSGATTTTATIAANGNTTTLYMKDTLTGTHTIALAATSLTSATQDNTVIAAAPNDLEIKTWTSTVTTDDCSTLTIKPIDSLGNVTAATSDITVTHTGLDNITFYSDSSCSSEITVGPTNINNGSSQVTIYYQQSTTATATSTIAVSGGGLAGDGDSQLITVNPGAAAKLLFTTEPVGGVIISTNLATQPVVKVLDQYDNIKTNDNSTVVTISSGSTCTTGGSGAAAAGGSQTASSGVATFSGLQWDSAETIRLEAKATGLTSDCAVATTTFYNPLSIVTTTPSPLGPAGTLQIEVAGGVPSNSYSITTNTTDGASLGSESSCNSNKCVTFTAGRSGGGVTEIFQVEDNSSSVQSATLNIVVNGAVLDMSGDAVGYGTVTQDTDHVFTVTNNGNMASGTVTTSISATNSSYWDATILDQCDSVNLSSSSNESCNVTVRFKYSTAVSGTHTATFRIEGSGGAFAEFSLSATK